MADRTFSPGFRLSARDVVTLIVGAVTACLVSRVDFWAGIAIGFVVIHFFLFCNVLRFSRLPELIWAAVFATLALTPTFAVISWSMVFIISGVLTAILALIESNRPSYHGVGWRYLNPNLPEWWRQQQLVAIEP